MTRIATNRFAAVAAWLALWAVFTSAAAAAAESTTTAPSAASAPRGVLVEGSPERLWVAEVVRSTDPSRPGVQTRVYRRSVPGEVWQRPMLIGAEVTGLSHRAAQLVALLEGGDWMFVWPEGRSTGPALPAGGELVTVSDDGMTVWGIGRVAGGMASVATRPAATGPATGPTTASAATQGATTRPAAATTTRAVPATGPLGLVLFRLDRTTWVPVAGLPSGIDAAGASPSLAMIGGRAYLATVAGGQVVLHEWSADGGWGEARRVRPEGPPATRAKVMDGGDRPILWVAPATGAGVLYFGGKEWTGPAELRVQADLSQPVPLDVAVSGQRVKLVFAKGDKLHVQSFDWRSGQAVGELQAITPVPAGGPDSRFNFWSNAVIMVVLLLVMLGTLRRRGEIEETVRRIEQIPLASFGTRVGAAVVDLVPYWGTMVYLAVRAGDTAELGAAWDRLHGTPLIVLAMGVYVAHTMIAELIFDTSVGKAIFGLKVVKMDGSRPGRGAIFVRNLLRFVDAGVMFVGAMMILMSPLRQRMGDLAGGTIVVRRNAEMKVTQEEEQGEVVEKENE